MATARQFEAPADVLLSRRRRLFIGLAAGVLAAGCAAIAFIFFVVRDHGHARVMVNEQAAPPRAAKSVPAPSIALPSPAPQAAPEHPFSATNRRRVVLTGSVRVRVLRADPANGWFDLSVTTGRATHSHRHLKVDEPLWVAVNRTTDIELRAKTISPGGITGFWRQADRSQRAVSSNSGLHPR